VYFGVNFVGVNIKHNFHCIYFKIDEESNGQEIKFKSNFMGSMTSGLTVPPNKIEFDTVSYIREFTTLLFNTTQSFGHSIERSS